MDETDIIKSPKIPILNIQEAAPYPAREVLVNGQELGEGVWDELITGSLAEGLEKGVVVATREGRVETGNIITGTEDKVFPPAEFSIRKKAKSRVFVHTHLVDVFADGEKGIVSTLPSQKDLQEFLRRRDYNAFVIVDAGGNGRVHLLVRGYLGVGIRDIPDGYLRNHFKSSMEGQAAVEATMENLASDLEKYGTLYYVNDGRKKERGHLQFRAPRIK